MPKLAHILKLILLGPQPRDEWYEEWSKDPLAEWFREQRKCRFWIRRPSILQRVLAESFMSILPLIVLIFALFFLPVWWVMLIVVVYFLNIRYNFGRQQMDKSRRLRPLGKAAYLFQPTTRAIPLTELWMSGMRGRDVLKLLYLESRESWFMSRCMYAILMLMAALVILLVGVTPLGHWYQLPFVLWLVWQIVWFESITSPSPFQSLAGQYGRRMGNPGLSLVQDSIFTKEEVPGRTVPMTPLIVMLALIVLTVCLALAEILPMWTVLFACMIPVASFFGYIHWYGRKMPDYDRDMIEDAFLHADRVFDQWVRTELIGDEDGYRG